MPFDAGSEYCSDVESTGTADDVHQAELCLAQDVAAMDRSIDGSGIGTDSWEAIGGVGPEKLRPEEIHPLGKVDEAGIAIEVIDAVIDTGDIPSEVDVAVGEDETLSGNEDRKEVAVMTLDADDDHCIRGGDTEVSQTVNEGATSDRSEAGEEGGSTEVVGAAEVGFSDAEDNVVASSAPSDIWEVVTMEEAIEEAVSTADAIIEDNVPVRAESGSEGPEELTTRAVDVVEEIAVREVDSEAISAAVETDTSDGAINTEVAVDGVKAVADAARMEENSVLVEVDASGSVAEDENMEEVVDSTSIIFETNVLTETAECERDLESSKEVSEREIDVEEATATHKVEMEVCTVLGELDPSEEAIAAKVAVEVSCEEVAPVAEDVTEGARSEEATSIAEIDAMKLIDGGRAIDERIDAANAKPKGDGREEIKLEEVNVVEELTADEIAADEHVSSREIDPTEMSIAGEAPVVDVCSPEVPAELQPVGQRVGAEGLAVSADVDASEIVTEEGAIAEIVDTAEAAIKPELGAQGMNAESKVGGCWEVSLKDFDEKTEAEDTRQKRHHDNVLSPAAIDTPEVILEEAENGKENEKENPKIEAEESAAAAEFCTSYVVVESEVPDVDATTSDLHPQEDTYADIGAREDDTVVGAEMDVSGFVIVEEAMSKDVPLDGDEEEIVTQGVNGEEGVGAPAVDRGADVEVNEVDAEGAAAAAEIDDGVVEG